MSLGELQNIEMPSSRFQDRRLGGESNREVVSCRAVRACLRARGLVAQWTWLAKVFATISPFPFWGADPFSLSGATSFPFSFPPQTSYPTLVGLIGIVSMFKTFKN